jgi:hypothetical protein
MGSDSLVIGVLQRDSLEEEFGFGSGHLKVWTIRN